MAAWLRAFAAADETADGRGLAVPPAAGLRPRPGGAGRRCSRASSPTPRCCSGRTRSSRSSARSRPGINPDIEIHERLTQADPTHIAALYGWVEHQAGPEVLQLGMLQQFLRTATDGWDLALASVRNLFAEEDLHAHEAGRRLRRRVDAARRGAARDPRARWPACSPPRTRRARREIAAGMTERLDAAAGRRAPAGRARRPPARCSTPPWARSTTCTCSGSTATCTSGRPCAPPWAGRSSTSRASRPSLSASAGARTPAGATPPA